MEEFFGFGFCFKPPLGPPHEQITGSRPMKANSKNSLWVPPAGVSAQEVASVYYVKGVCASVDLRVAGAAPCA